MGRDILGHSILGTPEIERDLSCADQNGKADAHAKGHAIPGTSILGAQRAPEIAQEGTSKARFNTEQLDRRDAEKGRADRQEGSRRGHRGSARRDGAANQAHDSSEEGQRG